MHRENLFRPDNIKQVVQKRSLVCFKKIQASSDFFTGIFVYMYLEIIEHIPAFLSNVVITLSFSSILPNQAT
jgi:hypothetical protein